MAVLHVNMDCDYLGSGFTLREDSELQKQA